MYRFSGGEALLEGYYGPGDGPILLDQVECRGHESDIAECDHPPWYEHDCSHSEDAAVQCGKFGGHMKDNFYIYQAETSTH